MKKLTRFWFNFEQTRSFSPVNLGCGITAYDYDDAITLLHKRVFTNETVPTITACIQDVDVSTLDPNHVLPNIGSVVVRGVWFPQGYQE